MKRIIFRRERSSFSILAVTFEMHAKNGKKNTREKVVGNENDESFPITAPKKLGETKGTCLTAP